ncbi:MAG TPA: hypothetical protein VEY12_07915 [Thermoplasmata archaeon]|nr:hypothetical protein [Thermoplasmata archaeon]
MDALHLADRDGKPYCGAEHGEVTRNPRDVDCLACSRRLRQEELEGRPGESEGE